MRRQYYIFSDPHLGHKTMYECGYRQKGFEEIILKNISDIHKDERTVFICLGDFTFYKYGYWSERYFELTKDCKNYFVKGNHDSKTTGWYLDSGWDWVGESMEMKIYGYNLLLTHKPQEYMREDIDYNIHGHLHEKVHRGGENDILTNKHILVSMELDNYRIDTLQRTVQVKGENITK